MGLGASAAQVVAQADVQSNVPHLPEELLVGHVLPHLGDRPLAAAACVARIWRRMAGEVCAARRAKLAADPQTLTFALRNPDGSLMAPARSGAVAKYPRMCLDALELQPGVVTALAPSACAAASGATAEVAYMHGSAGRAPVFTATFAAHVRTERRGGRGSMAALALRELRALQPGWLAAQLAEADARFWYSSWPELDAAAAAEL
ncbi:hypothetical protein WJX81_006200 [Elliptochloris bilobata]|uniref:F-box domain-containing protein n=1 Tax=Elliptochloris bilobata TaxID=381761 RepID=A0AAW1RKD0_9CHLO